MKTDNSLTSAKRIAIVARADKRRKLIEWSYENKAMLAGHELIATAVTAGLLEGTIDKSVSTLLPEDMGGYHEMAAMIKDDKVDVIFFFENPMRTFRPDDIIRQLLDVALEMNIVIAGDRSKIDFFEATA